MSWIERRTNDRILNGIKQNRKIFKTIQVSGKNIIGYILRNMNKFLGKIIKKRQKRPRTTKNIVH